jgi:hypothetical protein
LLGVYLDCLTIIGDGVFSVAGGLIGDAAADICANEPRADLYRLCVIGDRPIAVAFMHHGNAAAVIGLSIVRFDLNGFAVIRNRQIVVTLGLERASTV